MKRLTSLFALALLAGCTNVAEESDFVCAKNGKVYSGYSHKNFSGEYTGMTLVYLDKNLRVPFEANNADLKYFHCVTAEEYADLTPAEMKALLDSTIVAEKAPDGPRPEIR